MVPVDAWIHLRLGEAAKVMGRSGSNSTSFGMTTVEEHIVGPESFEYEAHILALDLRHTKVMASSGTHELEVLLRCVEHVDLEERFKSVLKHLGINPNYANYRLLKR